MIEYFLNMKIIKNTVFVILALSFISCSESQNYNAELKGNTMGTYYVINIVDIPKNLELKKIRLEIEKSLTLTNKILSNWDKSSEISKLNDVNKLSASECDWAENNLKRVWDHLDNYPILAKRDKQFNIFKRFLNRQKKTLNRYLKKLR